MSVVAQRANLHGVELGGVSQGLQVRQQILVIWFPKFELTSIGNVGGRVPWDGELYEDDGIAAPDTQIGSCSAGNNGRRHGGWGAAMSLEPWKVHKH